MNLEDIAKKAGVSRSTVSRVINNNSNVRAHIREQVWKVIREENFQPNLSARALVKRHTEIIGVVIPSVENIFFTDNNYFLQILAGISRVIREHDYAMLLWLGDFNDDDERLMQKVSNNHLMDGIIILSLPHEELVFNRLLKFHNPFVMVDRPVEHGEKINYVTVDNVQAAEDATDYLIGLGHRRIAHITGNMSIADARDRLLGYKNALNRAGLPIDPDLIVEGQFTRQAGYEVAKHLLPLKPEAIFAANDMIAVGVLQAAHEIGIRIPDDLALVGFDDVDVASQSIPKLTTVRQPLQEKGAAAAKLLIDLIQNRGNDPQHILLKTELVVRQSCKPVQSKEILLE